MSNLTLADLQRTVQIQTPKTVIEASLYVPENAIGIIIFAHNAGGNRYNAQDQYIAEALWEAGFGTLLIELLTEDEQRLDVLGKLSYDIALLAGRVDSAADWICRNETAAGLALGYYGAGTGAAAVFVASLQRPDTLGAIVSRAGRADLAESILSELKPPTLFIMEPLENVNENKRLARKTLTEKKITTIEGASSFDEAPDSLTEIAELTVSWFSQHLSRGVKRHSVCPSTHIDSCSFGRIRVDGKDYTRDLLVFGDKQVLSWWRKDNHRVCFHDLKDVIKRKPDLFIIGTGTLGNLQLESSARHMLKKYNINFREEKTQTASVLFNKAVENGTNAAGAFHITC